MKKSANYPKTQYEMNLERSAQLYPDGLRWSGMSKPSNRTFVPTIPLRCGSGGVSGGENV